MKKISRRNFLAATGTLAAWYQLKGMIPDEDFVKVDPDWFKSGIPYVRENGLNIIFYFVNLVNTGNKLIPVDSTVNSYLIVQLPPQSLHEQAFDLLPGGTLPGRQNTKLSGSSFLSFQLWPDYGTDFVKKMRFNVADLLNWSNSDLFKLTTTRDYKGNFNKYRNFDDVLQSGTLTATALKNLKGFARYRMLTNKLVKGNNLTLLELPAGLILAPHLDTKESSTLTVQNTFGNSYEQYNHFINGVDTRRTVQERWNLEVIYQQPDATTKKMQTIPPTLRAIGLIIPDGVNVTSAGPDKPCDLPDIQAGADGTGYLPTLLDEVELVYLNNLYKTDPAYDIKIKSPFLLTAVGASLKFSYQNSKFEPGDNFISLVEYEHHFQDGRDNFIKVSRIGIISPTSQKALHVRLAERKVVDGVTFMDYKEYVEILQPEKSFPDPGTTLPDTYMLLQDRTDNFINQINFNKIVARFSKTGPILPPAQTEKYFWVYKDGGQKVIENLLLLPFDYYDQNGKKLDKPVEHSILFIRRDFFCDPKNAIDLLQKGTDGKIPVAAFDNGMMRIPFGNQVVAFAKDVADNGDQLNIAAPASADRNKVNQIQTEFADYYFNIATQDPASTENIFDKSPFPIFPQIVRAKVLVDHIQQYANQRLPSLIEYEKDYLAHTFDNIENKAKLFIKHTDGFINNEIRDLSGIVVRYDQELEGGYNKITQVFNGAADKIGGLVNPDIHVERIALVKQALAMPGNVNAQWKQAQDRVLRAIDVFKGASAEILNGVDLKMILDEVLPAGSTPDFDLNKILSQVDKVKDYINSLGNNPVVLQALDAVDATNTAVQNAFGQIQIIEAAVQQKQNEILQFKNQLCAAIPDYNKIRNGAKIYFEQQRLAFLALAATKEDDVLKYVKNEFVREYNNVKAQLQGFAFDFKVELHDAIAKAAAQLQQTNNVLKSQLQSIDPNVINALDILFSPLLLNGGKTTGEMYVQLHFYSGTVSGSFVLSAGFKDYLNPDPANLGYIQLVGELNVKTAAYISNPTAVTQKALTDIKAMLVAKEAILGSALYGYIKILLSNYQLIDSYVDNARKAAFDKLFGLLALLQKASIGYYVDRFIQLQKDYQDIENTLVISKSVLVQLHQKTLDIINKREPLLDKYTALLIQSNVDIKQLSDAWNALQSTDNELLEYVETAIKNSAYAAALPDVATIKGQLNAAVTALDQSRNRFNAQLENYRKGLEEQAKSMLDQVKERFFDLISKETDLSKIQEANILFNKALIYLTTPQKQELNYNWEVDKFKSANLGIIRFNPQSNPKTKLTVSVHAAVTFDPLKYPSVIQDVNTYAENTLTDFGMTFLSCITIDFARVKYVSSSKTAASFDVQIRSVKFDGALSFIQKLQDMLSDLGNGFGMQINPDSVAIKYNSPVITISAPGFTFANISFGIALQVFFNKKPLQLTFMLASPENKATIAAGVYGGAFFCGMTMEAKRGIVGIEMAMEMGAYVGISIGPIKGEVKFMVGLYYKKDDNGVVLEGYFIAEGTLSVWILSVSARLYMFVRSRNSYVEGGCTVSYTVKLGFFKKSFSGSYTKHLAGAESASQTQRDTMALLYSYTFAHSASLYDTPPDLSGIFDDDDEYQVLDLGQWSAFYNQYYH